MITECAHEDCHRGRRSRVGYCLLHYKRWKRYGDASVIRKVNSLSLDARPDKVDKSGDCWLWTGAVDQDGYGVVRNGSRLHRVHRLAYEQWKGPIPDGLLVCHTCDTPPCIKPDHLWLGTNAENTADKMKKGRWAGGRPPKVAT